MSSPFSTDGVIMAESGKQISIPELLAMSQVTLMRCHSILTLVRIAQPVRCGSRLIYVAWSRTYASQPEIQKYYASVAKYYKLEQCTVFDTTVISATWDEESLMYTVRVKNTKTGIESTWTANVVVDAGGQFWRPKYANIPGKENFKGPQWHTSQWRSDLDLKDKRVAMIGTGPSTAQIAPQIQPLVRELILYQRSATYVVPRNDYSQPRWRQILFKWLPPFLWAYHVWWYLSVCLSQSPQLVLTRVID